MAKTFSEISAKTDFNHFLTVKELVLLMRFLHQRSLAERAVKPTVNVVDRFLYSSLFSALLSRLTALACDST